MDDKTIGGIATFIATCKRTIGPRSHTNARELLSNRRDRRKNDEIDGCVSERDSADEEEEEDESSVRKEGDEGPHEPCTT